MSGRVVHFEIPFDGDGNQAREFYREAFGWEVTEMPEMSYTIVSTGPGGEQGPSEPGYIGGGMWRRDSPDDSPVIVVDVDDIDAALAKIESLGGQTIIPRQAVGDMGFAAYFKDVEGNKMGLWQNA